MRDTAVLICLPLMARCLVAALAAFNDSFVQKAKVSDKPGETRKLAFYGLGEVLNPNPAASAKKMNALVLVDMPG